MYQVVRSPVTYSMKFFLSIWFIFVISGPVLAQQDGLYGEKRERHKVWRKTFKKKRQSYNPYLDRKGKNKPSSKMAREDKKYIKKSNREAKRQMRRSKRGLGKKGKK